MDELIDNIVTPAGILTNATRAEALAAGVSQRDIDEALSVAAWAALKSERARRLDASDWTMISDAPLSGSQKAAWKDYRQALRNLPATMLAAKTDPAADLTDLAIWPVAPTV